MHRNHSNAYPVSNSVFGPDIITGWILLESGHYQCVCRLEVFIISVKKGVRTLIEVLPYLYNVHPLINSTTIVIDSIILQVRPFTVFHYPLNKKKITPPQSPCGRQSPKYKSKGVIGPPLHTVTHCSRYLITGKVPKKLPRLISQ